MKTILILVNLETTIYNFRREVVQGMLDAGYQVVLSLPKGERWQYFLDMGCVLEEIPVDRHSTNPLKDTQLLVRYVKLLRRVKPDLVLTYTVKPNVYGGMACTLTGTPYCANITGLGNAIEGKGLLSKLTLWLYKLGLHSATTVFFQNTTNLEIFQNLRIVQQNVKLTPGSGVNLAVHSFVPYPEQDETLLILWIGRILRDKGIEEFLYAVSKLKEKYPHVSFEMLGRDDHKTYADQLTNMEGAGLLTYHGQQPSVDSYIQRAHAVVVPSYHEGLCNALLEASACGRPILTTTVPGCKETFDEGMTGFGCEARNPDALLAIMEHFIQEPYEKKQKMGQAAYAKVSQEFDRGAVVKIYMEELERILT